MATKTTPASGTSDLPQPSVQRRLFISHASGDDAFGHALAGWLEQELGPQWVVWYDSHGGPNERGEWPNGIAPRTNWQEEIQREVMACDVFMVIETQAAMASYWVQREIQMAWTRKPGAQVAAGLVVVPVLREVCDPPPLLALVQYVDYRADGDEARARRDLLYAVRARNTIPAPGMEVGPPFDLGVLRPADRFIGREADVEWIIARLTDQANQANQADGQVANIAAANGQGGIGKTALAAEAVRRLGAGLTFGDGVAALDCRDKHSEADVLALLQETLARFTPGRNTPTDDSFAALGDVARKLLGGKRALVVFDNVEPDLPASKLIAPLRAAGVAVLLTSRTPLAAAPNAASLKLDLLPEDDALTLFVSAYGRALNDADTAAARRIVRALGRHTLAVKLAAASAATLGRPLVALANDYERNPLRDAWLKDSETAVNFVLASSVAAMSTGGRRLFAACGAFATADVGRRATLALAAALGDDENEAESSLRWIVDLRLADPAVIELPGEDADRERLRLHPLTQAYARDLYAGRQALPASARWDETQREQVDRALIAWYVSYSNAGLDFALTPDDENIIGALERAQRLGDDRSVAHICNGMKGSWRDTGRTRAGLRWLPIGAQAAERIVAQTGMRDDQLLQANITLYYADILQNTGRLDQATTIYTQDLTLRQRLSDRQGEGLVLSSLGQVALQRGQLEDAAAYFHQSLPILREVGDRQGEGADLANLGHVALNRGQLEEAAAYFQQSLLILQAVADRRSEGVVLSSLGQVVYARGRLEEAEAYFQQGLVIDQEVGDRRGEGVDLASLGQVALARGRLEDAAAYFQQSLPIRREVGDRRGEGMVLSSLGQISVARRDFAGAAQAYRDGITALREVGDHINVAARLELLGAVLLQHTSDRVGGCASFAEAIALWQAIGLADREAAARKRAQRLGCE